MTSYTVFRIEQHTKQISREVDGIGRSTQAMLEHDDRDRVLRKICPDRIELDEMHYSALRLRKGSTGQWLISSPRFQSFVQSKRSSLLWLSGQRKCPERVLSSQLTDTKHKLGVERPSSGMYAPRSRGQGRIDGRKHHCYRDPLE